MTYALRNASPAKTRAEAVVVGVLQGKKGPELAPGAEDVTAAFGRKLRPLLATLGVSGKAGEVTRIPVGDELSTSLLVVVGLGKEADAASVRRAAGAAARAVPNATSVALALPADSAQLVSAIVEGHLLGGYSFTTYKKGNESEGGPATVTLLSSAARRPEVQQAFDDAQVIAAAVATVRDWVNTPPADLTPPVFAEKVVAAARGIRRVKVTVHDENALAEIGCGGILGVGNGSDAPPRLVELVYSPAKPVAHLALVGKGITFDTGGYTIKPGSGMSTMKSDMAGAATVVQALLVIAQLELPVKVSVFAPMAENMVSGQAMRPGDILRIYGGTTVEVSNTDAEGRLILADALVRATEVQPDVILDVATLTGAMVVALGDRITGVMGVEEVVAEVLSAAEGAGEDMWPMPIPEAIVERVHSSKVADLAQHDWIRWGGGLYAAAFLQEFTAGMPWAHLDIAGPSWHGGAPSGHLLPGGTGAALATLVEFARNSALRNA
ncbi:leucyl aminopeptidase [Nocardioides sp. Kera G14]|uniref:leucyl aminopeptidase n=1 Tax=Nocardioides sp. Kera G14 TaxID=2884264 RepID=UPI001D12BC3B|nr:leucyl aminopeptidase [Nocardioides sp. Kera G14]UDY25054.1 leucyl aminopeptidase [Nocardioides sp. Kera G14]